MCSNTGNPALFFHATEELLSRATYLREQGFRRVMLTGGEATIHPGFWTVVEELATLGFRWDINTHGRSFAAAGFAQRAVDNGLERAIVSLHSLTPATSAAIFGVNEVAHEESVEGVRCLVAAGVNVMLNCVINQLNLDQLHNYLPKARDTFGPSLTYKFVFPTTIGKGGQWPAIATLRYRDVANPVRALRRQAALLNVPIHFESFPNCILNDPDASNLGRSAFGESHYLDDASGNQLYSMRRIESELSVFAEICRACTALPHCPGISRLYAKRYGTEELTPFIDETIAHNAAGHCNA